MARSKYPSAAQIWARQLPTGFKIKDIRAIIRDKIPGPVKFEKLEAVRPSPQWDSTFVAVIVPKVDGERYFVSFNVGNGTRPEASGNVTGERGMGVQAIARGREPAATLRRLMGDLASARGWRRGNGDAEQRRKLRAALRGR